MGHLRARRALPRPGEIVHAAETWQDPGGGGGIVAVLLAVMAGGCDFFTAAAEDDGLPGALRDRGVTVHTATHPQSRRIFTHLDADGQRTITVLGDRLEPRGDDGLPWEALGGADGGSWEDAGGRTGTWAATPLPGPPVDASLAVASSRARSASTWPFGCGDAFVAALTLAMAAELPLEAALDLAARCGAATLAARGFYGAIDSMAAASASLR